jgi:hypothetical protein
MPGPVYVLYVSPELVGRYLVYDSESSGRIVVLTHCVKGVNRTGGERRVRKLNGDRECTRTVCGYFIQDHGSETTVSADRGYTEGNDFGAEETCAYNIGCGRGERLQLYESADNDQRRVVGVSTITTGRSGWSGYALRSVSAICARVTGSARGARITGFARVTSVTRGTGVTGSTGFTGFTGYSWVTRETRLARRTLRSLSTIVTGAGGKRHNGNR